MAQKYTVSEIDQMRRAVACTMAWGWRASDHDIQVEERLRTYMLNGTGVKELEEAAQEAAEEGLRRQQESMVMLDAEGRPFV